MIKLSLTKACEIGVEENLKLAKLGLRKVIYRGTVKKFYHVPSFQRE